MECVIEAAAVGAAVGKGGGTGGGDEGEGGGGGGGERKLVVLVMLAEAVEDPYAETKLEVNTLEVSLLSASENELAVA
eukprot:1514117-Pyramimonas_sp.AAC.3